MPVYDVNIHDLVTGDLLRREQPRLFSVGDCQVDFDHSEGGFSATITVKLDGHRDHVEANVENEAWIPGCFRRPSYTTDVSIY